MKTAERGPIAWMARNHSTANLLMIFLIAGGLYTTTRIKQEVFPAFDLDIVTVRVPYPGASPEEVEQGIVLAIEEAVRGIDGVHELRATAGEGGGFVSVELDEGVESLKAYQDIKQAVDGITTFPLDAEEARVSPMVRRREVLDLQIYGDVTERALRAVVEGVRARLLMHEHISQLEVEAARSVEIHAEVSQDTLRAYGLTLETVAQRIAAASVDLPGGKVETRGGEVLLRVKDRRSWATEFAAIPIVTTSTGGVRTLGEIADVTEGFEDVGRRGSYKGARSATLEIYRVADETPIGVSDAVREVMAEIEADLPTGVQWEINNDRSDMFRQRLELLLRNAFIGLVLVLVLLGLFLEPRLAFWVTMGIPTSFLGGLLFLPAADVSINMISMFAFIIALGIVVDDAIVAGENIFEMRSRGLSYAEAAVRGAKGVAIPVSFAILTNIVTFLPLYFVPGFIGKIWKVIPIVVVTTFVLSWVECLFILPAHLVHDPGRTGNGPLTRIRLMSTAGLWFFIDRVYGPILRLALRWRFATLGLAIATLAVVIGYVMGGHIGRTMMPRVESDTAVVTATLPVGSPDARAEAVRRRLVEAMDRVAAAHGGDELLVGTFARVDDNEVQARAYLTPPTQRPLSTREVTKLWREEVGAIVGLQSLRFESDRGGPGSGASLTVELSHWDISQLDRASTALADALREFPKVKDVDDGYAAGKSQLDFKLKPAGESLGLSSRDVARQVRAAFFGARALRQQRGRDEVTVLVRRPESERTSEHDIESLLIRTPKGREVPLSEVANVVRGRAFTVIERRDGRRTVTVTADVEPIGQTPQVMAALEEQVFPGLRRDIPGLTVGYEGRQAHFAEAASALGRGFGLALIAIYFLLAIPFRSYAQPVVVMLAIPFGLAGAVIGHVVMGFNISILSMMGAIALSGVVVNDSLVLIDYANHLRDEGTTAFEAAFEAARRRFRPVILTTLTTFGGLAPMIFETSRQARFMIPMAISLGFGIVFATVVTLIIVPTLYVMIDDASAILAPRRARLRKAPATGT